jgi:hypothetical protein
MDKYSRSGIEFLLCLNTKQRSRVGRMVGKEGRKKQRNEQKKEYIFYPIS